MSNTYSKKVAAIACLRVNVKSLSAEAKIIRAEIGKVDPIYAPALTEHRRGRLREEARYTHLALAYLRGRPYRAVEKTALVPVDAKRVWTKISRLTGGIDLGGVSGWLGQN